MNAYSRPRDIRLPPLSSQGVQRWMEKTQDLVLLLDAADRIAGVFQSEVFAAVDLYHWVGQDLNAIVSADSRPKLPPMLANDLARDGSDARWRHINLLGQSGQMLPVLARCMGLTGHGPVKAVFCRDLRPLQAVNDRWLAAQREWEHSNQALRERLLSQDATRSMAPTLDTDRLLQMIQQTTYAQVIRETVQDLERQCLQALLRDAGGDHARAAGMAGMGLSEWLEKLAALRVR